MKYIYKIAVMSICLIITALFTSACGGGGKSTPQNNSALYYLLAQQNNQQQENNNQQEEQNNNENNNNENNNENNNNENNNSENNEENPVVNNEITLTLTDSKDADKIAKADIYYKVESTAKTAEEPKDQEILKAEPTANDKTKFTLPINDKAENVKIKAVLTYDSEGNLLDYFSSASGVIGENGNFNVDFENSKDNEAGFADGDGTEDKPFIISAPRHFMNINKMFITNEVLTAILDDEIISEISSKGNISEDGIYISQDDIPDETLDQILAYYSSEGTDSPYLYLDKHFKQDKDLDFTHLTGLKIVKAENDKDITIETINEKAPFYNNGKGITPIGHYNPNIANLYMGPIMSIEPEDVNAFLAQFFFKGDYDGDNHIIDGLIFANGKSINIIQYLQSGPMLYSTIIDPKGHNFSTTGPGRIEKKIIINTTDYIPNYMTILSLFIGSYDSNFKNITIGENSIYFIDNSNTDNTNNVTPQNSPMFDFIPIVIDEPTETFEKTYFGISGICFQSHNSNFENCINKAKIVVKNTNYFALKIAGLVENCQSTTLTNCKNNGNITIDNVTNISTISLIPTLSGLNIDLLIGNPDNNVTEENCTYDGVITVEDQTINGRTYPEAN